MRSPTPAWLLLGLGSLCFVTVGACARVASQTTLIDWTAAGAAVELAAGDRRWRRAAIADPRTSRRSVATASAPRTKPATTATPSRTTAARRIAARSTPAIRAIPVGKPCHRVARCGDGVLVLPELCDDGNTKAGDGCSATCKVELGFKCSGSPSVCTPTKCGDKIVEGAESCDDGNTVPFDGCSADCQSEPNCTAPAAPASPVAATASLVPPRPATTATTSTATAARRPARSSPASCATSRRWAPACRCRSSTATSGTTIRPSSSRPRRDGRRRTRAWCRPPSTPRANRSSPGSRASSSPAWRRSRSGIATRPASITPRPAS